MRKFYFQTFERDLRNKGEFEVQMFLLLIMIIIEVGDYNSQG